MMTMEQLLAISGVAEPLKLSYDYCVVSHSRRIHSFLLSQDIPCEGLLSCSRLAQSPALYDVLVGPVQSPLFHQYLYGSRVPVCPLHVVGVTAADLATESKRRRRAKPRENRENKDNRENRENKENRENRENKDNRENRENKDNKEQTKRRRKKEETQPASAE